MPDPAELEMEEQINGMCKKLHMMPPPVLRLKMEVFMDGEKVSHYEDRARSWVRNYYNFMTMQTMGLLFGTLGQTFEAGKVTMKRTNGTVETSTVLTANFRGSNTAPMVDHHFRAAAGITAFGVVIGTNNAAESFESHALGALIANGSNAGQMDYAAMGALTATYDAGTKKFTQELVRYMNNNSGGSITVNEAGLVCRLTATSWTLTTTQDYLLARDIQSPGVAVPNTAQLKVTYTIESATYPV